MSRKNEKGQVLPTTAAAMFVLMGLLGLGIDMGVLRYEKRLQQSAADAAAVAGASNLAYGGVSTAAQAASTANGFTDASGGDVTKCDTGAAVGTVCVQINNGPKDVSVNGATIPGGTHAGNTNYVEAIVASTQPTFFMNIFGISQSTVIARAVATTASGAAPNSDCIYTLNPYLPGITNGVSVSGHPSISAPNCGIVDNGELAGNGNWSVIAATFAVSGPDQAGGGSITCSAVPASDCPATGASESADPLAYLNQITVPIPKTSYGSVSTSGTTTLQPGEYSYIDFGKNSTTTLNPGIYYINGSGITIEGKASVTGNGVMFYFTCPTGESPCGPGTSYSGPTINKAVGGGNQPDLLLTAMTAAQSTQYAGTAQFAGILFYQNPADSAPPYFSGDNNTTLNGTIYFPEAQLNLGGNADFTGTINGLIVTDSIQMWGNSKLNVTGNGGSFPGAVTANAVLVE